MKAIKLFTAILLAVSLMTMSAFAANFVPSVEWANGVKLVSYILEEIDTPCRTVLIIPYGNLQLKVFIDNEKYNITYDSSRELEEEVKEQLKAALEELEDNLIHHLVTGFDEAWEKATGGAPLENAIVSDLFGIYLICSEVQDFKTDEKVTVSFTAEGIGPDDRFVIVHKPTGEDKWIVEEHEIDENGVITIHPDNLSPFAIVKDSDAAPVVDPDAPDSPQTGVNENVMPAVAAMIILAGCAVICVKKLRKETV